MSLNVEGVLRNVRVRCFDIKAAWSRRAEGEHKLSCTNEVDRNNTSYLSCAQPDNAVRHIGYNQAAVPAPPAAPANKGIQPYIFNTANPVRVKTAIFLNMFSPFFDFR